MLVFGPNNFPFAYNGVAGGDFAAAIAAGNPVIAKAHPAIRSTTRLLAEEAFAAVRESGLPPATVQMIYHLAPEDGLQLVARSAARRGRFHRQPRGGLEIESRRRCRGQTDLSGDVQPESGGDFAGRAGGARRKNRRRNLRAVASWPAASSAPVPGLTIVFAGDGGRAIHRRREGKIGTHRARHPAFGRRGAQSGRQRANFAGRPARNCVTGGAPLAGQPVCQHAAARQRRELF